MSKLAEIFLNLISIKKNQIDDKSKYIFYKIVDSTSEGNYSLQCINTSAIFYSQINDIVFDVDILQGLHPIQSCFVGIEYAKYIKSLEKNTKLIKTNNFKLHKYSLSRYGKYHLCYQNRDGDLCFSDVSSNNEFIMDPRDIALSQELISEFDAFQAFYIGIVAGLRINNPTKKNGVKMNNSPYLYAIK